MSFRLPKALGGAQVELLSTHGDGTATVYHPDLGEITVPYDSLTKLRTEEPRYGERVRAQCSATGRYLRDGLVLVVSARDNDLFVDNIHPDGDPPHPTLPVPSDDALAGAAAALRSKTRQEGGVR